jgi:hypothetical protein
MPDQVPRQRFWLVLEVLPGDVPAVVRLRTLLKTGLRVLGLRCLEVRELPAAPPAAAAEGPAP